MTRYGFIGTGSMGSMLVAQLTGTGTVKPADIAASSKTGISARELADRTGITALPSNTAVAGNADVLFLCVKPLGVRGVMEEIRGVLRPGTLLVSIAGCVNLANLEAWAGGAVRCARVIPSVTAEQNAGILLVAWGSRIQPGDRALLLGLLSAIGTAMETDEEHLEVCTNLTSCGPALIASVMKEFAEAAVRTGAIPPEQAEFLVRETMAGTARILAGGGMTFDEVIDRVATQGGSTREGVEVLHARLPVVMDAVHEALFARRRIVTGMVEGKK